MSDKPIHRRSKSSLALSMLHRDRPKGDDKVEDGSSLAAPDTVSPTGSLTADSPTTTAPSSHLSIGRWHSRHKQRAAADAAAGVGSSASLAPSSHNHGSGNAATLLSQDRIMSIEQSVRIFRLLEALRGGDTTAILKAIRETSSDETIEGDTWGSTSSIGSTRRTSSQLEGTSILHLAVQCAEPQVVEYVLTAASPASGVSIDLNARDRDGNTPLHLAAMLGRAQIVRLLLEQKDVNESLTNYQGRTSLDLARNPEIFQQLQLSRSLFVDMMVREIQSLVASRDYPALEKLLEESRVGTAVDVDGGELATDPVTVQTGGTLLHEAARKKDTRLIQILLMHNADPFRRDRKGKLPQDITKDERTRGVLKKSPAAVAAQRGIQERAILGINASQAVSGTGNANDTAKEGREMKGYLKKWTNYTSGYKLRWFVLEDGVLSYYKDQGKIDHCINTTSLQVFLPVQTTQGQLAEAPSICGLPSYTWILKIEHDSRYKENRP